MSAVRIVLADNHSLVRNGIRALLEQVPDVEVVGEAATGPEALTLVAERRPDVVVLNISMPELNGLEATARLVREHPSAKVVVCSTHVDEEYVRRAFALGAAAYVSKGADPAELSLAVRAVARGDVWISPSVSRTVVEAMIRGEAPSSELQLLTARQREVLQLVAEGHTAKDIALRLGLSIKTVEAHKAQLMARLGVRGVAGLVRAAIRLGIIVPHV